MANNHDGLHPADIERLRNLPVTGEERFCVHFHHYDKSLRLTVNGVERNNIKLEDPDGGFELCLKLIKDQFLKWRSLKN